MKNIKKKCNYMKQLFGITPISLLEGKSNGTILYHVVTGSGLEYMVNCDRCLDIPMLKYKGVNISYQGREGIINSHYANFAAPKQFEHYYSGGMLFTSGIDNVGKECVYEGKFYPAHGRIGTTPASNIMLKNTDEELIISGEINHSYLFGENITLKRKIVSKPMKNELFIEDNITNNGATDSLYYILYHCNLGYPFLDSNSKIDIDCLQVTPRDAYAAAHIELSDNVVEPSDDLQECVFFKQMRNNDIARAKITNKDLGISFILEYETKYLPNFVQWSSFQSYDYALGFEPTNTLVRGRAEEIKANNKPLIKKGETITIKLKIILEDYN